MNVNDSRPIETIRLSESEKKRLVEKINQNSQVIAPDADRRSLRVDYRPTDVQVTVTHPTGSQVTFAVIPRNLSAGGFAFLHGRFLYMGSVCKIVLTTLDGQHLEVAGHIVGCRHIFGMIHEVGVAFERPINLTHFVHLAPQEEQAARLEMNQSDLGHVLVHLPRPGGSLMKYSVFPRTFSEHGLSFVHGLCFAPRTTCQVVIFDGDQESARRQAVVTACATLSRSAFEVMLVFDEVVSAKLTSDAASLPAPTHGVRPLSGSALVLDQTDCDRALLQMRLKKLGFSPLFADSREQAFKCLQKQNMDLVLMDLRVEVNQGLQLVRDLRLQGFSGLLVTLSVDEGDDLQAAALAAGANTFLAKPIDHPMFHRVIRQLMVTDLGPTDGMAPIRSSLSTDPDMAPLIAEFVTRVGQYVSQLQEGVGQMQLTSLRDLCRMLKGSGGGYGFEALSHAAQAALTNLNALRHDPAAIQAAIGELIAVARRLQAP